MSGSGALPVFVISLDRDHLRLARLRERMMVLDRSFVRWRATAGEDLDSARFGIGPISEGVYVTGFREWSKNEAACGVSHIRLLQHLVRNEVPWAVVLEDDAVVLRRIPLTCVELELPEDADIVLLNRRATVDVAHRNGSAFSYGPVTGGAGTEGYLISLAGARKLLKVLYPLRDPLDFQMYSHFESIQSLDSPPYYWRLPQNPAACGVLLRAYRIVPALVDHGGTQSTIGGERHPRARYYCKVLLGMDLPDLHDYAPFSPLPGLAVSGASRRGRPFEYRAVDVSHLDESLPYFAVGEGAASQPMSVLRAHGVNCVRISVWVGPGSRMNLRRALRLARLAWDAGLGIYLALHYSDSWADPIHQAKPAAWSGLPFGSLCQTVYRYTRGVVEAFGAQRTPPAIVQVGNEITNGMLWASGGQPASCGGQLFPCDERGDLPASDRQWPLFARLVNHAAAGVRQAVVGGTPPKIMLQIDKGAFPEIAAWWFDKARAHGIDFDIIGLSCYFLWHHATLPELARLSCLSAAFPDKEIMLAETAYPHRGADGITMAPPPENPSFTPDGQAEYLAAALAAMRELPTGCGLCWWGAFFLNDRFDRCKDQFLAQALFDADGVALPALAAFRPAVNGFQG
jgi:arabinogalactan endo-1,4-beta-galactosidase